MVQKALGRGAIYASGRLALGGPPEEPAVKNQYVKSELKGRIHESRGLVKLSILARQKNQPLFYFGKAELSFGFNTLYFSLLSIKEG